MTYREAIESLYGLRLHGMKLGLENTQQLAELVGRPQDRLPFIHVAGTNGKGSTCAILESLYRHAGYRVGLFTSPHLVHFNERIQVNRQPIPQPEVIRRVEALQPLLAKFPPDHPPTFFEAVTWIALQYFADERCDLVVWETGMGGRLDATNIVTPLVSIITNIQFDHSKWLGNTHAEIAAEKAGIIKPGIPVITGTDEPEALAVIESVAQRQGSPLTLVPKTQAHAGVLAEASLSLSGEHQWRNAALAIATMTELQSRFPVSPASCRAALGSVEWPGRLQLVTTPSLGQVLLDGAHNLSSAEALAHELQRHFPNRPLALIFGTLRDKDCVSMATVLGPLASRVLPVPVRSERSAPVEDLCAAFTRANPSAAVQSCGSLEEAMVTAQGTGFVLITGSLYLVGEAMERLQISQANDVAEHELNEYTPRL